jgi:hypothetical protein
VGDGGAPVSAYNVFRSTSAGAQGTRVATVYTGDNYIDSSVTNGITYYYEVTAVNRVGQSSPSNQLSASPSSSALPPVLSTSITVARHRITFTAPNKCVRAGRVHGNITVSATSTGGKRVRIGKAVFRVGTLARKTITRSPASSAPIKVYMRVRHMLSHHSYRFLAKPFVVVGRSKPQVKRLPLSITAC